MQALDQTVAADSLSANRHASNNMLDALGVYQHHDAVTGTAKDAVAKNYYDRLEAAMSTNNASYGEIVAQIAGNTLGVELESPTVCDFYHGSYVDCPTASLQAGDEFLVVAHNPASVEQPVMRIKAPNHSYEVSAFDATSGTWTDVASNTLCYDYWENNGKRDSSYTDCEIFVKSAVDPTSLSYLKVSSTADKPTLGTPLSDENNTISTSTQSLKMIDPTQSLFEYTNNDTTVQIKFNMAFYKPSIGDKVASEPSGAYVFAPDIDHQDSKTYSTFQGATLSQGQVASQFSLYFYDAETTEEYTAIVRLVEGVETIEYEVQLNEIPPINEKAKIGREVVAKWSIVGFDNQETFYTDSNGLAMQERKLNYRPDFVEVTDMTVSSNYYPINNAIAMRDTEQSL